jgi:hypothetical protein
MRWNDKICRSWGTVKSEQRKEMRKCWTVCLPMSGCSRLACPEGSGRQSLV